MFLCCSDLFIVKKLLVEKFEFCRFHLITKIFMNTAKRGSPVLDIWNELDSGSGGFCLDLISKPFSIWILVGVAVWKLLPPPALEALIHSFLYRSTAACGRNCTGPLPSGAALVWPWPACTLVGITCSVATQLYWRCWISLSRNVSISLVLLCILHDSLQRKLWVGYQVLWIVGETDWPKKHGAWEALEGMWF